MTSAPSTPGRRAEHKAATRRSIQDAATRLFDRHGYAGTTVSLIAGEAGVTERTLFRYFASKDELVAHRVLDRLPALQDLVASRPAGDSDLAVLRDALTLAVIHAGSAGDQPSLLTLFQEGPPGPRMLRTGATVLLQVEAALAEALHRRRVDGGAPGDAAPDLRCEVVAASAVAACRRALIRHARLRQQDPGHHPDLESLLDSAFAALGASHPAR